VAEVLAEGIELYHVRYDGFITDESGYVAIGGSSEAVTTQLGEGFRPGMSLGEAVRAARHALMTGENREIEPGRLEVAGLDRTRGRRKFFRLSEDEVAAALSESG
jgi:proteasome alpha subunit